MPDFQYVSRKKNLISSSALNLKEIQMLGASQKIKLKLASLAWTVSIYFYYSDRCGLCYFFKLPFVTAIAPPKKIHLNLKSTAAQLNLFRCRSLSRLLRVYRQDAIYIIELSTLFLHFSFPSLLLLLLPTDWIPLLTYFSNLESNQWLPIVCRHSTKFFP